MMETNNDKKSVLVFYLVPLLISAVFELVKNVRTEKYSKTL